MTTNPTVTTDFRMKMRKRKRSPTKTDFVTGAMIGLSIVVAVFVMLG